MVARPATGSLKEGAGHLAAARVLATSAAIAFLGLAALLPGTARAGPSLTTLFSFTDTTSGQRPLGALVFGPSGALFGTTSGGGANCDCGTVFMLTPPSRRGAAWTETVLHEFSGKDGSGPAGDLIFDASGALYGTTPSGGEFDHGAVFRMTPPARPGGAWAETVVHSFTALEDGNDPGPHLSIDRAGRLYGVVQFNSLGAGAVFQLQPPTVPGDPWRLDVLWTFGRDHDGANPVGGMVFGQGGALYGTTYDGGAFATGAVFRLAPPTSRNGAWTRSVIHSFPALGGGGANPVAGVVADRSGALFGTTFIGGRNADGVVFRLQPPAAGEGHWKAAVLHSFADNGRDGFAPVAPVLLTRSGVVYGTTPNGGLSDAGTVFELLPPARPDGIWTEKVLWNFHGLPVGGSTPDGGLIRDAVGNLYGTTSVGGTQCAPPVGCGGTVFMLRP
jgi:uncharacterized repeat protein (TIGR03803 family)